MNHVLNCCGQLVLTAGSLDSCLEGVCFAQTLALCCWMKKAVGSAGGQAAWLRPSWTKDGPDPLVFAELCNMPLGPCCFH